MTEREAKAKNQRRLDLIDKKYLGGGLDAVETEELAILQVEVMDYVAKKFPRDRTVIDEFSVWVDRMRAKVEAKRRTPPS